MTARDDRDTPLDPQIQQIIKSYKSNRSIGSILRRYGMTEGRLYRLLDKYGVPRRRQRPTPSDAIDAAEINRLYDQGLSIRAVAARLGLSYGTVQRRIPEDKRRPQGGAFNRNPWA